MESRESFSSSEGEIADDVEDTVGEVTLSSSDDSDSRITFLNSSVQLEDTSSDSEDEFDEYGRPLSSQDEEDYHDDLDLEYLDIQSKLAHWMRENKVTIRGGNDLLKILIDEGIFLPRDKRTLCQTERNVVLQEKAGGSYFYLGLRNGIEEEFSNGHQTENVLIDISVDGIPIFKSRKSQLWPILARFGVTKPFVVGCYYGPGHPNDPDSYMEDLVSELQLIIGVVLEYESYKYRVSIRCFICDTPARSMLKGIVGHTGFYSCERCTIKGRTEGGRRTFHHTGVMVKRTNEKFRSFEYSQGSKCHQRAHSPLIGIPGLNLISGFILDSMHMVYLGVARRILQSFRGQIKGIRRTKLSRQLMDMLNTKLLCCSGKLPSEFSRQPRSLDELDYWKATELRSFVLYTGMVVLKDVVTKNIYDHFMHLSVAISLLSCSHDDHRNESLTYCRYLLNHFVKNASKLYERPFISLNVHSIQHIPDDVEEYGVNLNSISAFPFESKLGQLKSMIRGKTNPLSELYRKCREHHCVPTKKRKLKISVKNKKDNCFETSSKIIIVKAQIGEEYRCNVYHKEQLGNVFKKPDESTRLGIYYIKKGTNFSVVNMTSEQLIYKCVNLPYKNGIAVIPMVDLDNHYQ